ncbi:MAG: rod shape-determining protein MreC [Burkholderiales bacterium]|nr:rod shape-determining protein MreC [Burkholderiales bacterium]
MEQELFSHGPSPAARLTFFTLLSLLFLISDAHYRYLDVLRIGIETATYPLQRLVMAPVDLARGVGSYLHAQNSLVGENVILKQQILENRAELLRMESLRRENDHLRRLFESAKKIRNPAVMAEIIYGARDPFSRKVIVDKGSFSHVREGSAVIDDSGLIGQVLRAYPWASEVSLITDKDHPTPVEVMRNGLRAVVFGFGSSNLLDLRYLSTNTDIREGDVLVTSGIDGTFPQGLPVATVIKVDRNPAYTFSRILCKPIAGVDQYRQVLIMAPSAPPPPLPVETPEPVNKGKK